MDEEGLMETANKSIFIGKPIELDEDEFFIDLKALKDAATAEEKDIRPFVKKIVTTYNYQQKD